MSIEQGGKWYEGLICSDEADDSLTRGLRLLDALRPILPPHKRPSVDRAKHLLSSAADLYGRACDINSRESFDIMEIIWRMPPENAAKLLSLCGALADFAEKTVSADDSAG